MPKKKNKGDVRFSSTIVKEGSKPKYIPVGKHRKSIKRIVKVIENLGFEFVSADNKVYFINSDRKCSIFFSQIASDVNAVRQIVRKLKKDLLNCDAPIDVDSLPANLDLLRLKGIGKMEEEPTIGDVLDACVSDNYSRISTEITIKTKEKLKKCSEKKGISIGELIEQMMDVYQKSQ